MRPLTLSRFGYYALSSPYSNIRSARRAYFSKKTDASSTVRVSVRYSIRYPAAFALQCRPNTV